MHKHARAHMQTGPQAPVYQPAVRGYTYNCVYGSAHLSKNIPPTRTLKKKSHLFSAAICKYSTMNLTNRVNHFLSAASSPILRFTTFNLQMFFSFSFFTLTGTYSLRHSLFFPLTEEVNYKRWNNKRAGNHGGQRLFVSGQKKSNCEKSCRRSVVIGGEVLKSSVSTAVTSMAEAAEKDDDGIESFWNGS